MTGRLGLCADCVEACFLAPSLWQKRDSAAPTPAWVMFTERSSGPGIVAELRASVEWDREIALNGLRGTWGYAEVLADGRGYCVPHFIGRRGR